MEERNFTVEGRIWITTSNGSSIGEGKILLLEKIHKLGSLRQASIEMKMSYQQAWNTINTLNHQFEKPLVILKRGGKDGGKAEITDFGQKIISYFHNLQTQFKQFLNNKCDCPNH
jgi:molybdate transport system regulatory protein